MFYNLYYEDNDHQLFDTTEYTDKIVKVIVRKNTNPVQFEKFIDKLYQSNVADLKVVENFDYNGFDSEKFEEGCESEDTISILDRYIEEFDTELDKSIIQNLVKEIYQEACEMV